MRVQYVLVTAVTCAVSVVASAPVLAGEPIPAPLAGAAGPFALLAAGVAYLSYCAYRRHSRR
jgi:hypothetical protein